MKVELMPSTAAAAIVEGVEPCRAPSTHQFASSYLIDGSICVDAGSIGFSSLRRQRAVRHLFLTHTHMDHIATLPLLLENVYSFVDDPVIVVHGSKATIDILQSDLFNDRVWPDFIALSEGRSPFLVLREFEPGQTVDLGDHSVTAIAVDHVVPTQAIHVRGPATGGGTSSVIIGGDTGPIEELWTYANGLDDLAALFIECSFPDHMSELAGIAKHLTPKTFLEQVEQVNGDSKFFAVHIKTSFYEEVVAALHAHGNSRIEICEPGRAYEF